MKKIKHYLEIWVYYYYPQELVIFLVIPIVIYALRTDGYVPIDSLGIISIIAFCCYILNVRIKGPDQRIKYRPHPDLDLDSLRVDQLIELSEILKDVATPETNQEVIDKIAEKVLDKS